MVLTDTNYTWIDCGDFADATSHFTTTIEQLKALRAAEKVPEPSTKTCTTAGGQVDVVEVRVAQPSFVLAQTEPQIVHIAFDIEMSDKPEDTPQMPSELAIILDISGSMSGEPLERSKAAIIQTIDSLSEEDFLHFITYSTNSEIIFSDKMTADNKRDVKLRVMDIQTNGFTNMVSGICDGVQSMVERGEGGNNRRLFLFTDGEVNRGVQATEEIAAIVESVHCNFGINTTAFGFGSSYNEELMRKIAAKGHGDYFYIEGVDDLDFKVKKGLSVLQSLYAINSKLSVLVSGSDKCETKITKLFGYQEAAGSVAQARVGDLCFDDLRQIVCQLEVANAEMEWKEEIPLVDYVLTYEELNKETGNVNVRETKGTVSVKLSSDKVKVNEIPDSLRVAMTIQQVNQNDKAILKLVRDQNYEEACKQQQGNIDELQGILDIDQTGVVVHLLTSARALLTKLENVEDPESVEMDAGYNEYRGSIVHRKCF